MDESQKSKGSWWQTVPGILTATAGTITAVTGLIVALHQAGLFGGGDTPGLQPGVESKSPPIESARNIPKLRQESSGQETVTLSESIIEPIRPMAQPEPPQTPKAINLLSPENGGQVLLAPSDAWLQTIDGKEEEYTGVQAGEEAVFAFKNEQAATFNTFSMLIPKSGRNPKEFELLAGESPAGPFRSMGKFQTQNVRLMKTGGWQEFIFPPVTATYFKVKLLSNHADVVWIHLYELRLFGQSKEEVAR